MGKQKSKPRAQRKFAQGAFIPPQSHQNPTAVATPRGLHRPVGIPGPITYNECSAKDMLTAMSLGKIHPHLNLNPVVNLEYNEELSKKVSKMEDPGKITKYHLRHRPKGRKAFKQPTQPSKQIEPSEPFTSKDHIEPSQPSQYIEPSQSSQPREPTQENIRETRSPSFAESEDIPLSLYASGGDLLRPIKYQMFYDGKRKRGRPKMISLNKPMPVQKAPVKRKAPSNHDIGNKKAKKMKATQKKKHRSSSEFSSTSEVFHGFVCPDINSSAFDDHEDGLDAPSQQQTATSQTRHRSALTRRGSNRSNKQTSSGISVNAENCSTDAVVRNKYFRYNCRTYALNDLQELLRNRSGGKCNRCKRCELLSKYQITMEMLPVSSSNEPDVLEDLPRCVFDFGSEDDALKVIRRGRELVRTVLTTNRLPVWLSNLEMTLKKSMFQEANKLGTLQRTIHLDKNDLTVNQIITRIDYLNQCLSEDKREMAAAKKRKSSSKKGKMPPVNKAAAAKTFRKRACKIPDTSLDTTVALPVQNESNIGVALDIKMKERCAWEAENLDLNVHCSKQSRTEYLENVVLNVAHCSKQSPTEYLENLDINVAHCSKQSPTEHLENLDLNVAHCSKQSSCEHLENLDLNVAHCSKQRPTEYLENLDLNVAHCSKQSPTEYLKNLDDDVAHCSKQSPTENLKEGSAENLFEEDPEEINQMTLYYEASPERPEEDVPEDHIFKVEVNCPFIVKLNINDFEGEEEHENIVLAEDSFESHTDNQTEGLHEGTVAILSCSSLKTFPEGQAVNSIKGPANDLADVIVEGPIEIPVKLAESPTEGLLAEDFVKGPSDGLAEDSINGPADYLAEGFVEDPVESPAVNLTGSSLDTTDLLETLSEGLVEDSVRGPVDGQAGGLVIGSIEAAKTLASIILPTDFRIKATVAANGLINMFTLVEDIMCKLNEKITNDCAKRQKLSGRLSQSPSQDISNEEINMNEIEDYINNTSEGLTEGTVHEITTNSRENITDSLAEGPIEGPTQNPSQGLSIEVINNNEIEDDINSTTDSLAEGTVHDVTTNSRENSTEGLAGGSIAGPVGNSTEGLGRDQHGVTKKNTLKPLYKYNIADHEYRPNPEEARANEQGQCNESNVIEVHLSDSDNELEIIEDINLSDDELQVNEEIQTATGTNNDEIESDDEPILVEENIQPPESDDNRPNSRFPSQERLIYRPTLEEFRDPIEYIEKIRASASKYGICKIIPPTKLDIPCHLDDNSMFTTINQYVGRLYQRWGPSSEQLTSIQTHVALLASPRERDQFTKPALFYGVELDLVKLYKAVTSRGGIEKMMARKSRWARVAEEMGLVSPRSRLDYKKLEKLYCKHVLPYESLTEEDRSSIREKINMVWTERNISALRRIRRPLIDQECLDKGCNRDRNEEHIVIYDQCEDVRIVGKPCFDRIEECTAKGRTMNLTTFRRVASQVESIRYRNERKPASVHAIEDGYWKIVSQGVEHICVQSAFIDTSVDSLGHPADPDALGGRHPWNLKRLSENPKNVLSSLVKTLSVTEPTICLNQLYSTSCWHLDPHKLAWMDFMHEGPTKIWYAVGEPDVKQFRSAMEDLAPNAVRHKEIWLASDTIMVPPDMLLDYDTPLQRIEQNPGEFIIVFPGAYASSIATGYTVSESIYFENKSWVLEIDKIFLKMRQNCEPAMFSNILLLFRMARNPGVSSDILPAVQQSIKNLIDEEMGLRRTAVSLNCTITVDQSERPDKQRGPISWPHQDECSICRVPLILSKTTHYKKPRMLMCLKHGIKSLRNVRRRRRGDPLPITLLYTDAELDGILQNLQCRLDSNEPSVAVPDNSTEDGDDDMEIMTLSCRAPGSSNL